MSFEERYAGAHEAVFGLSDDETVAFGRALGRLVDSELQGGNGLLVQAVKARSAILCPDDALYLVGQARDIPRFPGESADAYRARVTIPFDVHSWSGTAVGIADYSLEAYCTALGATAPVVTVLEDWQGAFPSTYGSWYSRFAVVIQGGTWTGGTLGGTWVLGTTALGSTATAAEISQVKLQVRRIKDAHSASVVVRVAVADVDLLGIDWTLGTSALADPSSVTEWVMLPLFGVDWTLGFSALCAYEL